jgi:hypothetical protein
VGDPDTPSAARSAIHREQSILTLKLAQFPDGAVGMKFDEIPATC